MLRIEALKNSASNQNNNVTYIQQCVWVDVHDDGADADADVAEADAADVDAAEADVNSDLFAADTGAATSAGGAGGAASMSFLCSAND